MQENPGKYIFIQVNIYLFSTNKRRYKMSRYRVKIQDKLEFSSSEVQHLKHQERLYRVSIWGGESFRIIDVTDAGKRGAVCPELTVDSDHQAPETAYWNDLLVEHTPRLLETTTKQEIPKELKKTYFSFYLGQVEAKRLLPLDLSIIKPLKTEPKKWTLPHVVRALVNGQFKELYKNSRYTDDYAWDSATNYGEGPISDVIDFVERIVRNPGGWWVRKGCNGVVSICCHSFDNNEFTPVIEGH